MHKLTVLVVILAVSNSQQNLIDSDQSSLCTYFIPNFTANWFKAAEYCQYLGFRLAVIDSAEKEANLYSTIKASDVYDPTSTRVWVGANDLAEEGNFHWQATGKRIRYANWVPSGPDNFEGDEDCVEVGINRGVFNFSWQWNDDDCKTMHYFACEYVVD